MPDKKIVDLGGLKKFRQETDNRYVIEGEYSPNTSVGLSDEAENLTPYGENSGATGTNPFIFQTSGGSSDVGSRAYLRALRGNSVVFNQLIKNGNFEDTSNWYVDSGTFSVSNNVCSYTSNDAVDNALNQPNLYNQGVVNGHKYLMRADIKLTTATDKVYLYLGYSDPRGVATTATTDWQTLTHIVTLTAQIGGSDCWLFVRDRRTSDWDEIQVKNVVLIDLTLMFGAGKEPTSVLEFNRLFPKPYYPYNAGTLLSCKTNGIKNVLYNAYDNSNPTDFIKVVVGQTYTLEGNGSVALYDYDKNLLSDTFVSENALPSSCCFVKITGGDNTTCFHLTWDSSRTGYEPYESETYQLPNVLLRSAGNIYDELKPDGTLTRRVNVVDLGTLTWTKSNTYQGEFHTDLSSNYASATRYKKPNILCANYITIASEYPSAVFDNNDNIISIQPSTRLFIIDKSKASMTASQFKTAMSGVYLFYELATPTETQDDDYKYQESQDIDDFGTQEFLYDNDIAIPVPQGNEFFYPVDYKTFIDSLGGREDIEYDANQIVSQTELGVVSSRIPALPSDSADGTYTLKATMSSGTITYAWVLDE